MYLILRIILYPLCLGICIWCAVQFKEGFEGRELRRYKIDTENPGEPIKNGKDVEASTEEDPTEEDPTEEDPTEEDPTEEDPTEEDPTEEALQKNESLNESSEELSINPDDKIINDNVETNEVGGVVIDNKKPEGSLMGYFAGMLISILTFAFFVARDVGNLAGSRFAVGYYNKSAKSEKADLYEEAEQLWADGAYIESIDSLRNYIEKYPGEFHAHQRIAEIYENDLASYRAAAMEYESILTMELSPKRWGWAAIHLCNLYSGKLGETEKALALLRRVADECADTTPGEKARDRLNKIDAM